MSRVKSRVDYCRVINRVEHSSAEQISVEGSVAWCREEQTEVEEYI